MAGFLGFFAATCQGVSISPVFPDDGEEQSSQWPNLGVWMSDSVHTNLSVDFYARPLMPRPDFMVVALPDTQFYTHGVRGGTPETFAAQVDWIVTNRVNRNIVFVTHLGDIVDSGDFSEAEWWAATNALYRLESPETTGLEYGIPYGLGVGNHDGNLPPYGKGAVLFNRYFGVSHFEGRPYYGGHYGTNNNNHFVLFSASGLDFIALHLEFACGTNAPVMEWANNVLRQHANRRAIVVTHSVLRNSVEALNLPFSAEGEAIYEAIKANTNIFMIVGGHDPESGMRTMTYNGNTITIMRADYSNATNGGNGWLRTYEFSPSNNVIRAKTYSPLLDEYKSTHVIHQFNLNYDMRGSVLIDALSNASPGFVISSNLTRLPAASGYEWFVEVKDGGNVVRSASWKFLVNSFENGTNASPLRLVRMRRDRQGRTMFSWASVGSRRYRVEYSDANSLRGFTGEFKEIVRSEAEETDPSPPGTPGVQFFLDDYRLTGGPPPAGARYFRVRQLQ